MKSNERKLTELAFHEVKANPPKRVARTLRAKGQKAADKQMKAIALSKARKLGVKV